ncbi:MAG: DUF3313 family protein [Halieaceae bacterium]|nr:DUF3313 family protein [Halieaceae bacterium]
MRLLLKLSTLVRLLIAMVLTIACPSVYAQERDTTFDNLVRVEDAKVAGVFIDPDADFSIYKRVDILEPYVAFRANWQRDQVRSNPANRVSSSDMDRIRTAAGELLMDVFIEALEANQGYTVVDHPGDDVLVLRPAIIDLDISAPDNRGAGRSNSFSTTAGAATLYIELFDGASGKIIGRAIDRRVASRPGGQMQWSNSVTNTSDARRMFRVWADRLREFLDSHYSGN